MTPIEVPFATTPFRIFVGAFCLLVIVVIARWAIPNIGNFLRTFDKRTAAQNFWGTVVWMVVLGFLMIPSTIFIALVRNPLTIVSDDGISQDELLTSQKKSIGWNQIATVSCTYVRSHPMTGEISSLTVHSADGERIEMSNSGTPVLGPVYEELQKRLPQGVVQTCSTPLHH